MVKKKLPKKEAKKKAVISKGVSPKSKIRGKKVVRKPKKVAKKKVSKKVVEKMARKRVKKKAEKMAKKGQFDANLIIGDKTFDNPASVVAFYRSEGNKVKQAIRQFKLDEAEGKLEIAKNKFLKVQSQEKKLDVIEKDLKAHKDAIDEKITHLGSTKDKEKNHDACIQGFMKKMDTLEEEARQIIQTRENLMSDQSKLIVEMKDLAKTAQGDLDIRSLESVQTLLDFEDSKDAVLIKARDLLSEELRVLFLDKEIIQGFSNKSHQDMAELNKKLAEAHEERKEALQRINLLNENETDVRAKLRSADIKVKQLEKRYEKFLEK